MATRVLFTIDTELTWRHHAAGCDWEENYALSVEPAGVGLGYQLAQLRRHGLKGVFFIDPMPAARFGLDPVKRMVDAVLSAGQDVQLHLHPMWTGIMPCGGLEPGTEFELCDYDLDQQTELIAQARDILVEAGAPAPIAFRSGSYAANDDTLRALRALGIPYDCSHNGSEAPWPSGISLPQDEVAPMKHKGVTVLPVSQVVQPLGSLRHTQICALSFREIRMALDFGIAQKLPFFTLVCHSFELATRDGRKPNRVVRNRFDSLCRLLRRWRDKCPTVHFGDLDKVPVDATVMPAPGSLRLAAVRHVEQAWANLIERFA